MERDPRPITEDRETTREKFPKHFARTTDLALERSEYKVGKPVDNVVRQFKRRFSAFIVSFFFLNSFGATLL